MTERKARAKADSLWELEKELQGLRRKRILRFAQDDKSTKLTIGLGSGMSFGTWVAGAAYFVAGRL
jgi:hypothetical protein